MQKWSQRERQTAIWRRIQTELFFQEGDYIRIKRTGKQGKVNATDGGVVYVVMDETKEAKIFSAAVDEDAFIELIPTEAKA